VVHDVDADTTLAWRDAMLVGGLRSVAALPWLSTRSPSARS